MYVVLYIQSRELTNKSVSSRTNFVVSSYIDIRVIYYLTLCVSSCIFVIVFKFSSEIRKNSNLLKNVS